MTSPLGLRRRALLRAFDPLTIAWHTAFWARDLSLSDGASVSTWADSSGNGHDATQATAAEQPTFKQSVSALNGRPAVLCDNVDDNMQTAAFTSLSQPNTIVAVANANTLEANTPFDGITSTDRHQTWMGGVGSDRWLTYAGTTIDAGAASATAGVHLIFSVFDATDTVDIDGTQVISGDAGSQSLTGLTLFTDNGGNNPWDGHIAFLGLYDGLLTAQEKSDLEGWAQSYYGVAGPLA